MAAPELPSRTGPYGDSESVPRFYTNGHDLYEVASITANYGLAGGEFTTLQDCVSGKTATVDDKYLLFLTEVRPEEMRL